MSLTEQFDPYHRWLSIPPAEQPATLYRLLGLSPLETDAEVIHAAADRQMAYLRTLSAGKHADTAQQLLNEVSKARVTLTGPNKANYDAVLQGAGPADVQQEEAPAPVASAGPVAKPARGDTLGPFDLVELNRPSPFGDIYKACHRDSGRIISLKVLTPAAAKNVEVMRRFQREQQIVTQLRHPNLISGLGHGVEDGHPWLAMEYVVGMDLGSLVRQQGPLPVEQAVDFLVQAGRGFMQLHMRDVFHRNVKPQVLWADVQGHVKVTNLFLAKLGEHADVGGGNDELTIQGQQMGTAEYLSPEQALDAKATDQRSDIYSLGCTLHYLLTGRPPYVEKSLMKKLAAHQTAPIPSLTAARPDIPPHVDEVFQRMLAKDPAGRFPSMAEMIDRLTPKVKRTFWQRIFGT